MKSSSSNLPSTYFLMDRVASDLAEWFLAAGRLGVEDVAVLAGFRTVNGDAVVTTALHPDAERRPGWYEQRDGQSWRDIYMFGHEHRMHYLIQVHTHPIGYSTSHSPIDDVGAFSDRLGFLSVVVPDLGLRGVDLLARDATVHERVSTGWRVWAHAETLDRIRVVPGCVDYSTG